VQLPKYTQQQEWWVDRLDLHPGKTFLGVNTSGLAQRNVIQVGASHHEEADYVTLYKGRHSFEVYEDPRTAAFLRNESNALANWTGHVMPVNRTPAAVPVPPIPMLSLNGSRAYVVFQTTSHYVDLGFKMRYQAVFCDPQLCESWGRGWGPGAEAEVNKAAQITVRTARFVFPHMTDWRDPAERGTKWYMDQGGAHFVVRLYQHFNGTDYVVHGSYEDLHTGYYMITYTPERVGDHKVDVMIQGTRGLEHIHGSPFHVHIRMGPTDPRGCRLIGRSIGEGQVVEPGKRVMFRIQSGDAFFNRKLHGGDFYVVKLDGPEPTGGVVKDMKDGTYNASFSVTKSGTYTVFVGISYMNKYETAIHGSPFHIKVPKLPCPPNFLEATENKEAGPEDDPYLPYDEALVCSGHGECQDSGKCKCVPAYDGDDCTTELIEPYRQTIIIENVLVICLVLLYGVYKLYQYQTRKKGGNENALGELDDDEDEEVTFKGLKCCMHW